MQSGLYIINLSTSTPNKIETKSKNRIYPNPTTDKITIISEAEKIIIYNSLGIKVKEKRINHNQNTISIDNLNRGLYFYCLNKGDRNLKSGKIILR